MIRKLLALLCCLLVAAPFALAEETIAATPYTLSDVGVTLSVPNVYNLVVTLDLPEDSAVYTMLGMTKAEADSYLKTNSVYLDAMAATTSGFAKELILQVQYMSDLEAEGVATFHGLSDETLNEVVEGIQDTYASLGHTIADYAVFRGDQLTFLLLMIETSDGSIVLQGITLRDYTMYNLNLTPIQNALTQTDIQQMEFMLNSFVIAD